MFRLTPIVALSLFLFACSGDDPEPQADAGPDAPEEETLRDISGSVVDRHLVDGTAVMAPRDLSATTVAAHVPNDEGGYDVIAGLGATDGTFQIEGVPEGSYLAQVGAVYLQTSSSTIELGGRRLGRPDTVSILAPGTTLTFNVAGLAAFAGESIDFHAPNAGNTVDYAIAPRLTPPLADGATAVTGVLDWGASTLPGLIEGAKGDVAYMVTLARTAEADSATRVITQFAQVDPFDMVDGQNTDVPVATLVNVPSDQTVAVSFDLSDWDAALADFGPTDLVTPTPTISFYINESDALGDLSLIEFGGVETNSAFAGSLSYGNPFPATWKIAESAGAFGVGFVDPPANTTLGVSFIGSTDDLGAYVGNAVPRLGVITAPQINGADLLVPQTSNATPTISWSAPTVGTPTRYAVSVRELRAGSTRGISVASFSTTATSIVIPSGLLASGSQYFVQILASRSSADTESAPFLPSGFSEDSTQRPTAVFTIE